jgi:hypothetical protein
MPITINGTGTVTGIIAGGLPDAIITQPELAANVVGNGPAFSATMSANQSVTSSTYTKVVFNTEDFDTNSNYDTTTYRFTPTVAGYYQINASIYPNTTVTQINCSIYKNGAAYRAVSGTSASSACSSIVYLNGTTDYVEIYAYLAGTSPVILSTSTVSYFNGCLVRSA